MLDSQGASLDPDLLESSETFRRLVELLAREDEVAAGSLWGASQALVFAGLQRRLQGPWIVCLSTEAEAESFLDDLAVFGLEAQFFPARESYSSRSTATGSAHADPESVRRRLQVAQQLAGPPERRPRVLVCSVLSLLQPLPTPSDLANDFLHLQTGLELDTEDLLERLVGAGFTRQPLAERPGEVSLRGDILDVFPFASELPLRIELFDDEIESLRTFEPESQRSVESVAKIALCIASDAGGVEDGKGVPPVSLLSPTTHFVEIEPLRIEEQAEGLRIQSSAHARGLLELREAKRHWKRISLASLPAQSINFDTRSVQGLAVGAKAAPAALQEEAQQGARVVVLCINDAEKQRFGELLGERDVETLVGSVGRGFRLPEAGLIVVNHRELSGLLGARKRVHKERKLNVRALESFFELRLGDLVVHAVHGVARYVGLERMERAGGEEEHLQLEFANEVKVFVPASRIDLVQRYIGSGSAAPELDKIGSQSFRKRKEKVERAIVDLAGELLEVQAQREMKTRPAWEFDRELMDEMVAAFPYEDTGDQAAADREIGVDLTSKRAMDRLLCGDVGFGKTEVAIRAAFRVVSGGGQVAVLVPTTVLAHQHYETFRERLADFPVEVASLSRYVKGKRAKEAISRTARGEVDILIGTHRILSKDVSFKNLGLVIIDEEQRFGVTHKEHFKRMRYETDVLTLTATPIPRTLHMSLSGLRDISALSEPPEGRQEIDTLIAWTDDTAKIREALLREKNRGGQVFFLHNRVHSIEQRARELMALVPELSYCIGHGQMTGPQLREVMERFVRGEADVLVATTIVENGIDIPSAGTILMDDADHFGLAELHQLRGRVGRGNHKAYCYLLVDRTRPLRDVARQRIKALEELTQLGAGFQISMKDLELRGAGNILGPQQSGHIAAIGYDMYCRLLKQTVERMQEGGGEREDLYRRIPAEVTAELEASAVEIELGMRAFLPNEWIQSANDRLDILRKLNTIHSEEDARDRLAMLRDRFGRVPVEAETLVEQFLLRALLAECGVKRLLYREDAYVIEYADRVRLEQALADAKVELRLLGAGKAHLVIPEPRRTPEKAARWIHGLLEGSSPRP